MIEWIVDHGHAAPEGRLVRWLWAHLNTLTDGRLAIIAQVGLAYGALQLVESYGLFRRRKWAEWLVVIATTIPIPFELYELFHEPSLSRFLIVLGNVLYAGYLQSGGPKEALIRKAPEAHRILFEFKEYVGLVPLPLAVAAAFIAWRYRAGLRRDRYLAELAALLLLLLVVYCVLPLGLGASITRLRGIL